ncbi:MAG: hypothetical protein N2444_06740, partial [Methylocystis sp.]|nr:hypothetical protein [Methylocystis sp.]
PDDPFLLTALAYSLAQAKQRAEAESIVDALAAGTSIYAPPCALAAPVLALGRKEEALDLLRRAREDGCPWFAFTKFDFRFLPLRAEIEQLRATAPHEYVQPKGAGATLKSARI